MMEGLRTYFAAGAERPDSFSEMNVTTVARERQLQQGWRKGIKYVALD